jgi:hypothetical protein
MLLFTKFLDTVTEPLTEADCHARVAIDDGIEILTRDLQEHRIVESADIRPMRFATEQWHLAKTITITVGGKNTVPSALEPRVGLKSTRNDDIKRVARVIFAHNEVALFDRDKFSALGQAFHQLLAKAGQNWHVFKYLELVLHAVILPTNTLFQPERRRSFLQHLH